MDKLLVNIKGLLQVRPQKTGFIKGIQMKELPILENSWLLIQDGKIAGFGEMHNCPEADIEKIDCSGRYVFPSYVDPHTHLVFAGSREHEFVMRIKGATYEEISAQGGGILNSAIRLQHTPEEELLEGAVRRLNEVMLSGTGAIEIKSGYGLSLESEIKILKVIRDLKALSLIPIKSTFLGAHAIPQQYKSNRRIYIDEIVNEMIPQIAGEDLADYIDVFCDQGFFTPEETDEILNTGQKYGLRPRLHANELAASGGIQVGVKHKAISVDHLEFTGDEEISVLKSSDTIPVLLPSTAFFLNLKNPPARKMIDSGLGVALASDYNPGTSPSGNMSFVLSLACLHLKMLPEEALNAATINSAAALELEETHGSITIGKAGSVVITQPMNSWYYLPYSFATNRIETVILNGKIIS